MIKKEQIKAIHTFKARLKWDNDAYRNFLWGQCKVSSCTELTIIQAKECLQIMSELIEEAEQSDKCSIKQASYLRYQWLKVDYSNCDEGDRYLSSFLNKKYGVLKPESLSRTQAQGAIYAIKKMIENVNKKGVKVANNIVIDDKTGKQYVWVTSSDGKRYKQEIPNNNKGS